MSKVAEAQKITCAKITTFAVDDRNEKAIIKSEGAKEST